MAVDKPGNEEDAEADIASSVVVEVFEAFGSLSHRLEYAPDYHRVVQAYREYDVDKIHKAKDDMAGLDQINAVARENEGTGEDVVREHLHIVFPSLLDIYDDDLLQPECKLYEVVPFEKAIHLLSRPVRPYFAEVEEIWRVI